MFSFMFAVGVGALWEIFEFAMDSIFGLDMQKAMLGDPSGLTDTMWDLILDALGALTISTIGYGDLRHGSEACPSSKPGSSGPFDSNPRLFRRGDRKDEGASE
ncbi:MAG: hypothetical protein U5O39_03165 [Gammaproteobacteria bacterium]|nr:hypothetical protein [Gammaproteobacteria bacterium]